MVQLEPGDAIDEVREMSTRRRALLLKSKRILFRPLPMVSKALLSELLDGLSKTKRDKIEADYGPEIRSYLQGLPDKDPDLTDHWAKRKEKGRRRDERMKRENPSPSDLEVRWPSPSARSEINAWEPSKRFRALAEADPTHRAQLQRVLGLPIDFSEWSEDRQVEVIGVLKGMAAVTYKATGERYGTSSKGQ